MNPKINRDLGISFELSLNINCEQNFVGRITNH